MAVQNYSPVGMLIFGMAEKLIFKYDREADILHIDKCPPYAEQESEEIGDDVVIRLNPQINQIEKL